MASGEGKLRFQVEAVSGHARAGVLATSRSEVLTPVFMPVATQATVKSLTSAEVAATGCRMLISNTYHLWLRPGSEVIAELGGLHKFMDWPHLIATDSGGFQAFSLSERTRLTEDGFRFASHLDGSPRMLTPEESMRVQGQLGSDIAMQLDVCPPAGVDAAQLLDAVERTTRWAERCLTVKAVGQALFGIVQGGTDVELRLRHAETLGKLPLDGLALGGFSVGEAPEEMHRVLPQVAPYLDIARPRYLMGVGTPKDLIVAIGAGVDMFDCVIPTRNARNGQAFTRSGRVVIKNARYRSDSGPLEDGCGCPACSAGVSRAYLRHLFVAGEILGHRLLTAHNLEFYQRLVRDARVAILEGVFAQWAEATLCTVDSGKA